MRYHVVFSCKAKMQLDAMYEYIADSASSEIAEEFTEAITSFCESLQTFPLRGCHRKDIKIGLYIIHYKKRTQILYTVDKATKDVIIHGIFYGGQDYATKWYNEYGVQS